MKALIEAAFARSRVVLLLLAAILTLGTWSYVSIPKESAPEVQIPTIYVMTSLEGISPQDAISSLVKPLETELGALEGLDTLEAHGFEGGASLVLEFDPGFDADKALDDVRLAVDRATPELPEDATDPVIQELNTALLPIMTIVLSGPVPERSLNLAAEQLAESIESLEGVLEVDIGGKREDLVEVIIDPLAFQTYDLSLVDIAGQVAQNNRLVAAGALDSGDGRLVMKVPGLVETADDLLDMPVKVSGNTVVSFADIADIRRSFKDPESYARIDGIPAISLEIRKKSGANIIETVARIEAVLAGAERTWPDRLDATITQDESEQVETLLGDLENNVIASILLVLIVILAALGPRSALLVGASIPGAFLAGVAVLWMAGYTMNIVVLFALILVAGMLVDGAIVVIEDADRRIAQGTCPRQAYAEAAKRMAWPVIASAATTLSVFLPLLFWEGVVGEFMKYMPITVLFTLSASLVMALVFVPVLGAALSRKTSSLQSPVHIADPRLAGGVTGVYARLLETVLLHPRLTLLAGISTLALVVALFLRAGNGVEFFPAVEPDYAQIEILSRDNLSNAGKDALLQQVESRLDGHPEIASLYARSGGSARIGAGAAADRIGTIQVKFIDWQDRRPARVILEDIRSDLSTIPGLRIAAAVQKNGPSSGKPIALQIAGPDPEARRHAVQSLREEMERIGGFTDISDSLPLPGVDYEIQVSRAEAARFGADIGLIGQALRLLTSGLTISDYRPDDTNDTVDIRVRFPEDERTLNRVLNLRIPTGRGMIPISNFVDISPIARSGTVIRIDGEAIDTLQADVAPGVLVNDKIIALKDFIETSPPADVDIRFQGEARDQAEAMAFLSAAFLAAVFLMLVILVAQFNSLSQAGLVLSAILFSVGGVFLALLVTGRPFGVVMSGIGIISLAGIVVNTNIVLIDTYNEKRRAGLGPLSAALISGSERLRPVFLTTITTILGLMPMAVGASVDIPGREIVFGAPSTQWWTALSTSIVGGLSFATLLTLLVTPAMLVLIDGRARRTELTAGRRNRRSENPDSDGPERKENTPLGTEKASKSDR